MFYGRGAGGAPTASAPCSATSSRSARNRLSGGRGPRASRRTPDLRGAPDGRGASRATTSASTSTDRPACSPRSRRRSPPTTVASDRPPGGRGDEATLVVVTHRRPTPRWPRPSRSCARSTWSARSLSVHAGRGRAEADALTGHRSRRTRTSGAGVIEEYRDRLPVDRRDAGRDAARGRHAAGPGADALRGHRLRASTSRWRARTPPGRSRTAG